MAFSETHGVNTSTSMALSVTADVRVADPFTPANLTLTEITSGTSEDWACFDVFVDVGSNARSIVCVCAGAIGSEELVAVFPGSSALTGSDGIAVPVPIPIASGTRLSIGISAALSATPEVQIKGLPSSNFSAEPSYTVMHSGPYDLQSSSATYGRFATVDPGGTANTKGAYSEISESDTNGANNVLNGDSLGEQYDWLGMLLGDDYQIQTDQSRLWDVAYGIAASEQPILSNSFQHVYSSEVTESTAVIRWVKWARPSGDRISSRMQCSITDAADRIGTVLLFGIK